MRRGFAFKTMLLVTGLCAVVIGGSTYLEYHNFHVNGRVAKVELAVAPVNGKIPGPRPGSRALQLKFKTETGDQVFISPIVSPSIVDKLENGGDVEIVYIKSDPHRFMFKGGELSKGGYWIAIGVALIGLFAYALRLS